MREPIIKFVGRNLRLLAAIGAHAPDLHRAAALGVEVNGPAIGRVVRTVIKTLGGCQARLPAAGGWNCVDIELAIALGTKGERFAIGRPAVPVGWSQRGYAPGSAPGGRQRINDRAPLL